MPKDKKKKTKSKESSEVKAPVEGKSEVEINVESLAKDREGKQAIFNESIK